MSTFILDTVEGTSLSAQFATREHVRTGIMTGVSVSPGATNSYVLEEVMASVVAAHPMGGDYKASDGTVIEGLKLQRVQVAPKAPSIFQIIMQYSTATGLTPSSFIIDDSAVASNFSTNLLPGTRAPIRLGWESAANPADKVPEDNLTISVMMPVRSVGVTALVYGRPPQGNQDAVGCVNQFDWYNRPPGHWLLKEYGIKLSRYQGYYQINAVAIARPVNLGDWSETGVLFNSQTGKYVKVEQADIDAMNALPYAFGIISTGARAKSGIIRVGPYSTADFTTIMGFTTPPT